MPQDANRRGPDPDARRVMTTEDARLSGKAVAEGDAKGGHFIEGYAAVWNNVDLGDERMLRGAFTKSLSERVPANRVKLMVKHFLFGGDVLNCIGTVTEAKEDDFGLWFHAGLVPDDADAEAVFNKVATGHVGYCSVGYGPVRWQHTEENGKQILEHLECKLYEVTLTVQPMNEMAMVTAAKALGLAEGKELSTLATLQSIDASTPEGRAQLDAIGRDGVAKVAAALDGLAAKVHALMQQPPQDTAGNGPDVDLHELARTTARCRVALEALALEMEP